MAVSPQQIKVLAVVILLSLVMSLLAVTGRSAFQMTKSDWQQKIQQNKQERNQTFSFASYYSNHIILQRAPKRAIIWGYSPSIGEEITLKMSEGSSHTNTVYTDSQDSYTTRVYRDPTYNNGVWRIKLRRESGPGPFTITAKSGGKTIELKDVMFGDVWLCSGQSNMVFTVQQSFNASEEFADANNYPDIRVMTVNYDVSPTPLQDLKRVMEPWSRGSSAAVNAKDKSYLSAVCWVFGSTGKNRFPGPGNLRDTNAAVHGTNSSYFSAVCWFYGRALYKEFGYPIGLITTAWGGTMVEVWSSPDALAKCGMNSTISHCITVPTRDPKIIIPKTPSCLWKSMVNPFVNMTIYGAIWYQGEGNTHHYKHKYNCTFPAMIDDWRLKFHDGSGGETDAMFPFGFVQLGPHRPNSDILGYPEVRWHQTADYGYVPNPRMQNVFMAVAVDLTDFGSPYVGVHFRDKQDVSARLTLSALSVAYNRPGILYQGPLPTHIIEGTDNISLVYSTKIKYNYMVGFEALCPVKNSNLTFWIHVPVLQPLQPDRLYLWSGPCGQGETIIGLRYLWQVSPCAFKTCTVYSADNPLLPGPPFIVYKQMTRVEGTVHRIDWNTPVTIL